MIPANHPAHPYLKQMEEVHGNRWPSMAIRRFADLAGISILISDKEAMELVQEYRALKLWLHEAVEASSDPLTLA